MKIKLKLRRGNINIAGTMILSLTLALLAVTRIILLYQGQVHAAGPETYNNLRVCAMHPWIASEGESACPDCGMMLSEVHNHPPGAPLPPEDNLFVSSDDPMYIHEGPGKDPGGSALIPVKDSPYYEPRKSSEQDHSPQDDTAEIQDASGLWTCGMHPDVISDEPGICPICQMDLTPLKAGTSKGSGTIEIDPLIVQNIGVVLEHAGKRDLSRRIRSYGVVKVSEEKEFKINAKVSGWVDKLYVKSTGDAVRKGQRLMDIYSPELVTAQEELLTSLQTASKMNSAGAASDRLANAARRKMEYLDVPQTEIDRIIAEKSVRRTVPVVSPADGVILSKNAVEGGYFKEGADLFHLADLTELWVIAQFYEFEIPWVQTGDRVEISSPYDPDLKTTGKVDFIYPVLDAKSRSADVRIVIANPGLKFRPEMALDVVLDSEPISGVVSVSKEAVVRSGTKDFVFVALGEGKFEPREVHIGLETDDYYEIQHNLREHEAVVRSAQFLFDSEAKLREAIQKRLAARKAAGLQKVEAEDMNTGHTGH